LLGDLHGQTSAYRHCNKGPRKLRLSPENFGLKFVKRVPTSPRGGGVFLTDGHINFAFLDFSTDEAAEMEGGVYYEGLHHLGFHVEDIDETSRFLKKQMPNASVKRREAAMTFTLS
jgi:hypothetical protein